jgi:hypothetical protein
MTTHQLHETPANGTTTGAEHADRPEPADSDPHVHSFTEDMPAKGRGKTILLVAGVAAAGAAGGFLAGRRTAPSATTRQLRRLRRKAVAGTAKTAPKLAFRSARTAPKTTWWVAKTTPKVAWTTRRAMKKLRA